MPINEKKIAPITNWQRFCLLTWKNWKIYFHHKKEIFFEILLPVIFLSLLLFVRLLTNTKLIPNSLTFPPIDIKFNFSEGIAQKKIKDFKFGYYPDSPCLKDVAKFAETWLTENNNIPSNPKFEVLAFKSFNKIEELVNNDEMIAGIEFDDSFKQATECPKKLIYQIRFPSDLRTHRDTPNLEHWQSNFLFPPFSSGMRGYDTVVDIDPSYYNEGFIGIQHAIALGFITRLQKVKIPVPNLVMNRFPYPPHVCDPITSLFEIFMSALVVLSFIYTVGQLVKQITTEKEKQLKEFTKIFGMANWIHWLAWFARSFPQTLILCSIIVIFFKIPVKDGRALLTYCEWSILFFFLTVYMFSLITFCFMVTTFFEKASTASAVSGLLWFIFYVPYWLTHQNYKILPLFLKLFYCIFANTAVAYGIRLILILENTEEGLQWSNFYRAVNVDDDLTVSYVMFMMVFDSIIYLLICLYIEQIRPGKYGIPQNWYFLFTKSFWSPPKGTEYAAHSYSGRPIARNNPGGFEAEPRTKKIGIAIKGLTKKYSGKLAVDDLTINMYEGEITILLGHNGAGKTTTISMLTGMLRPNKGTAYLNGYDIQLNLRNARKSLGLCPQHNILFDELSVRDHIVFYSRLKGLERDEIEEEVQKYIILLELEPKMHAQSQNLSGGMKRKLSVAAALCGGSKVVLLDEPTAGMDPSARRALWNLLQVERSKRTILLSTHFMDEADVLGDRIAIMSMGGLKAYGTSFFLKRKFGSGYHLICVKKENCNSSAVTKLLSQYIPLIEIENEIGAELSYSLPTSHINKFNEMLKKLEDKTEELNLEGFGISNTTLEEVFMLIGSEKSEIVIGKNYEFPSESNFSSHIRLLRGFGLCLNQWKAMLLKKCIHTKRNFLLFLIQTILPIIFVLLTILMYIEFYPVLKPMLFDLSKYDKTITILEVENLNNNPIAKEYVKVIESVGKNAAINIITDNFQNYILKLEKENIVAVNSEYPIGCTLKGNDIKAWFNAQFLHSMPLSLNVAHNAMIRAVSEDPSYQISVSNNPLKYNEFAKLKQSDNRLFGTQLAIFFGFCYAFVIAFYIIFIIKERVCRAKLLQFVTGVKILTFWFTQFVYDYLTYLLSVIFGLVTLYFFQKLGLDTFQDMGRCFLIFLFFGLSSIPLTYLMAFNYTESASGFTRVTTFYSLVGMALFIVVILIKSVNIDIANILNGIFLVFPHYFLCRSISSVHDLSFKKNNCMDLCKLQVENGNENCDMDYLCTIHPTYCCLNEFYDTEGDGIGLNLIVTSIMSVIFFMILLLVEYKVFSNIYHTASLHFFEKYYKSNIVIPSNDLDDDVLREKNDISKMSRNQIRNTNLVLHNLTKYYWKFLAVREISVAIPHSECFGLLGINGAGKTTTFKMLNGDHKITYGDAYVKGISIKKNLRKVYNHIGYCPQFDALFDDFTGREMLKIFGLIHGIPEKKVSAVSKNLAKNFGFQKHLDKTSQTYSGGNKRKLSVAIALIGDPSVIYLDEPTAGMDPASKRQLWSQISKIRSEGKTIVLTSHSMEECEALCTRLAIMVNGEFLCLGSIQHLKNKFAKGLVLKIKTAKPKHLEGVSVQSMLRIYSQYKASQISDLFNDPGTDAITDFVQKKFPNAEIKEQYRGLLTYYIPRGNIKWSTIFGVMEANKEKLKIEDYSISQTTLEEIFLDFAKYQKDENKAEK